MIRSERTHSYTSFEKDKAVDDHQRRFDSPLQTPSSCPVMACPTGGGAIKHSRWSAQRPSRPYTPPQLSFTCRAHTVQQPHTSSTTSPGGQSGRSGEHDEGRHRSQVSADTTAKLCSNSSTIAVVIVSLSTSHGDGDLPDVTFWSCRRVRWWWRWRCGPAPCWRRPTRGRNAGGEAAWA